MSRRNELSVPLLKTCQTCFQAKIRCDRTQDSGLCDRCLRLGKTCIFAPARRRNGRQSSRLERRDAHITTSQSSASGTAALESSHRNHLLGTLLSWDHGDEASMCSPFSRGLLTFDRGQDFLDIFRTKMMPYFPFVVIPESMTILDLANTKPFLCVATMSVASHADPKLQMTLATLFSELIVLRMVSGEFVSLDILQGLLVQLSWAHYQPRPRRYSQHLSLAVSIVSDMRLDRPRKTSMWMVGGAKRSSDEDWGSDEKRAFAGTYYLSSSSSVLLQKSKLLSYTPFVLECCQQLASKAEQPTDKYLPYIVHLQKMTEDVDGIVSRSSNDQDVLQANTELSIITERYIFTKSTLPFPLSDCPTIHLQLNVLDLIISQSSSGGTSFGLNKFQDVEQSALDQTRLLDWLSQSISAVKSLLSVVLVLPQGEEGSMPNIGWIMLYCAMSIAVRLDMVAAHPAIAQTTRHLRRILDMPHTIRQVVLRLEGAAGPDDGSGEDRGPFQHLARRARRIEEFLLQQDKQTNLGSNNGSSTLTPADSSSSNPQPGFGLPGVPESLTDTLSTAQVTSDGDGVCDDEWPSTFMADLGTEYGFNNAFPYYVADFT